MFSKTYPCHMIVKLEISRQTTLKFLSNFKKICSLGKKLLNPDGQREKYDDTMTLSVAFYTWLTISVICYKGREGLRKYCLSYKQNSCQFKTHLHALHSIMHLIWVIKVTKFFSLWMLANLNFIGPMHNNIYYFVTTISFLTPPIYYQLQKAPCVIQNSVPTINPDIHMMCEVPATVNVYRAECSLSDALLIFISFLVICKYM
jgi:hypothetical protein